MASTSVLHKLRPQLVRYLSYDDIKHHLLNHKLLTYNEYQKLDLLEKNASDCELVERVLELVMRKGPKHDAIFVQALGQSLKENASPHLGNQELLPLLQRELDLQQSQQVSFPSLNAHIINGEEVEKDGIYLFPLSPGDKHGEFSNAGHNQAVRQERSELGEWDRNFTPPLAGSTKWIMTSGTIGQEQPYPGGYSTSSPVFYPRADWNTPIIGQRSPTRPPLAQSTSVAGVTRSLNSMSLNQTEGVRGKLQARAAMTLGDFSVVQEVRRMHQDPEDLKCQIVKESRAIIRKYATLVLQVYRLLQKLSAPFEEVRLALITLGCTQSQPGSGPSSSPLFPGTSEIAKAKNMLELVMSLHSYSSWFNYDLIKFLGEQFGGTEGVDLIAAYEDELREFFKKFVFECPQFAGHATPDGFTEMVMKVDWEYHNCKTQDVAIFKTTVTELLEIEPHALRLKSVEEGCVLLTWMVSSSTIPHIALCLSKLSVMEKLAKERTQYVTIPGRLFEVPTPLCMLANESSAQPYPSNNLVSSLLKNSELKRRNSFDFCNSTTASMTPTVSSLSDVTDASTPYHHRSGASLCGSSASKRAFSNRFSDASVDEFFAETHSMQEAEILSLYSGERSPASTIDRYSKRNSKRSSRDSSLLLEAHSSSLQLQGSTASDFALSDTNMHQVACRLGCSIQEKWHKSETDVAHLKNMCEKSKGKEKQKPKPVKYRFSLQRIMSFRKHRTVKKNLQTRRSRSSTSIATFASLPTQLVSPVECIDSLCAFQHLPVLELSSEPMSALGGKPHYYSFTDSLSHSSAKKMTVEIQVEVSDNTNGKRGDGTSVASLEWQPSMSDSLILADASKENTGKISEYSSSSAYSSQETPDSQDKTLTPILTADFVNDVGCQPDLSMSHSQPCPSSSTQPWKSFSSSPSSDAIHACNTQPRNQAHTCMDSDYSHLRQRSHSASMAAHHRLAFSDDYSHMGRVISPSCSVNSYQISSGYGSRRSSDCSLSQMDNFAPQICILEEQDNYCYSGRSLSIDGQHRARGSVVQRHNSLGSRSRNLVTHDTSPLVRNRSNSMHK